MSRRPADITPGPIPRLRQRVGVNRLVGVPRWTVAAAAALWAVTSAHALSLGSLAVRSAQGEPLVAEIAVDAMSSTEQASLQARIASPDAFRAAGLAFEPSLRGAQLALARDVQGRTVLRLTGQVPAASAFVDLIVEASWSTGRLVREFTLLLPAATARTPDAGNAPTASPASLPVPPPVLVAAPVLEAPVPEPAATPAPAPNTEAAQAVPARTPAEPAAAPAPPTPAPAASSTPAPQAVEPAAGPSAAAATPPTSAPASAEPVAPPMAKSDKQARGSYRVRQGDTLARIAKERAVPGTKPEQQWIGILRGNPQAFVKGNVNLLKSGQTLDLPSEEEVRAVDEAEARALVAQQRQAFDADRRRLAAQAATSAASSADKLQRSQGAVRELAPAAPPEPKPLPTPDRLELSKSTTSPAQVQQERKVAEELALKAAQDREAELRRNLEALKQLQAERAQQAKPSGTASASGTASSSSVAPGSAASSPAPAVSATSPTVIAELTPPSAPANAEVAPSASTPNAAEKPAEPASLEPQSKSASDAAPATPPAPASPETTPPADKPQEADQMDNWLNSAWALPLAAVLALLVVAGGAWGFWQRRRASSLRESSAADAALVDELGSPSEQDMLGELGALSDVDPVAEADVYLAYGRDRQAEEILREALAADAGNLRYHGKLLEILALRKDTNAFVEHAQIVADLTGREGRDWAQVAVFGRQLAPNLPLFASAAEPWMADQDEVLAPSAATSDAQEWPALAEEPTPLARDSDFPAGLSDFGDDTPLSLDGELAQADTSVKAPQAEPDVAGDSAVSASAPQAWPEAPDGPEIDLGMDAEPVVAEAAQPTTEEGDIEDMGEGDEAVAAAGPAAAPSPFPGGVDPFEGLSLDLDVPEDLPVEPNADVMARKLSLAEEFVQLGDQDGASELLREVVAQAEDEAQRAQAQDRLDRLS